MFEKKAQLMDIMEILFSLEKGFVVGIELEKRWPPEDGGEREFLHARVHPVNSFYVEKGDNEAPDIIEAFKIPDDKCLWCVDYYFLVFEKQMAETFLDPEYDPAKKADFFLKPIGGAYELIDMLKELFDLGGVTFWVIDF